jgi:hypothetical protein
MDKTEASLQLTLNLLSNTAVQQAITSSAAKNKDNLDAAAAIVASAFSTIFCELDKLI